MTHVIVVGGGVAGSAVAYFASLSGAQVTLVDAGEGTASAVPSALINPVRGQNGRVESRAPEGLALTWSLIEHLQRHGHLIPHGRRGVWRPVPDAQTRRRWQQHFPAGLAHIWRPPTEIPGLAPGWEAVLELPGAGWIDGPAFVRALRSASRAVVLREWALRLSQHEVTLQNGQVLHADRVVWCGGSIGVSRQGWPAQHRAGSLLLLTEAPTELPLSFGAYVAPATQGGVLGATFEAPQPTYDPQPPPKTSRDWLDERARRLLGWVPGPARGIWTGSRLSTRTVGPQPDGTWALTGLGSKGFLLGPLLARDLTCQAAFWPDGRGPLP
ncbi:FAD-dependent oxidoreductase [Deinococcus peraridilitoris]|uniref:Glycine/D-amino acid oxidase, deaminating n=1 Tax=Deinococcus peraridilitoris (strain DSM 19664 / LMG 22246 / CIP 109416 / KR-200) TaxID=937777 RepID=L0A706_DEIPD|nr:FAD-dependent oxidoreductase [Deinococcus peraridilitoris]AFZ69234.1 glycine/D-amino acid oxidase, deaminating [Deinococcus peraridilitoris DSM 19664]